MMRALLAACLLSPAVASAQPHHGAPQVRAALITETRSLREGTPLGVALRLVVAPGWHIYWTNPGESGLPTTVEWRLPSGFRVGTLQWPFPERREVEGLTVNAYEGEVIVLGTVHPPARIPVNTTVDIVARVRVGVCREVCIAQDLEVDASLPTSEGVPRPDSRWIGMFRSAMPRMSRPLPGWLIEARSGNGEILLRVTPRGSSRLPEGPITFFPEEQGMVAVATTPPPRAPGQSLVLRLPDVPRDAGTARRLRGVLVARSAWDRRGSIRALAVDVTVRPDSGH